MEEPGSLSGDDGEAVREDVASVVLVDRAEDVAAVCGRVDAAPTWAVVIHAPEGNRPLGTELGMRRLIHHAQDAGKVIAIACGIADGLGFGHNTRAAVITRGLAEISRLGVRLGCNPLTLAGLAGMGDLVLTCNGPQSRNRQAGLLFAQGKSLAEVQTAMRQIAEGIRTTRSVHDLAAKVGVEMPISAAIYRVLYENQPVGQVMSDLLGRPPRHELG